MYYFSLILVGFLGLVFGSFLTVLVYRLPRGISIITPRSYCKRCKRKIYWYDNIPLFLLLRGRCRFCKKKIGFGYFAIETITALAFLGIFIAGAKCLPGVESPLCAWRTQYGPFFLPFTLFVFLIVFAVFLIDLEEKIIPDELVFLGFAVTSTLFLLSGSPYFFTHLSTAFSSGTFLLLIHLVTGGRGMGLGDVKFAIFGGFLLGWPLALVWLFVAFLTGAIVGLILILTKRVRFGQHIAFGPFLAMALVITLFWGDILMSFTP